MKKGIWGIVVTAMLALIIGLTLYFEKSLDSTRINQVREPIVTDLTKTEFIPLEEAEFSVTIQEEVDASNQESEESDWKYAVIEVEGGFDPEDFYIVMEYSNVGITPNAAICYTPDFAESYTAVSINENMSGEIVFKPQTCKEGVWYLLLCENESLGTYSVYGISGNSYEKLKNPVILKPRDLDAPGALLPDE